MTEPQSFAAALRQAMTARGVTDSQLAERIGVDRTAIWAWRTGRRNPLGHYAVLLADALDADAITNIVSQMHRRVCARCGRSFIAQMNHPRYRFCRRSCQDLASYRKRVAVGKRGERAARAEVRRLHAVIAKMCRSCEPTGHCRDSECALRNVSPLPLIQLTRRKAA